MKCPDCKEIPGKLVGIGCPVFKRVEIDCSRCDGTAQVPDEQEQWIEEGKKIRAWRDKRDLSLREAAQLLLIQPSFLSVIERGSAKAEGPIRKILDEVQP